MSELSSPLEAILRAAGSSERHSVDWDRIHQRLSTTLPQDFQMLVEHLGTGRWEKLDLVLFDPDPAAIDNLISEVEKQADLDRQNRLPLRIFPEPNGLLLWGRNLAGRPLYWETVGPPDRWTVVHATNDDRLCGTGERTAEFLSQHIAGDTAPQHRDTCSGLATRPVAPQTGATDAEALRELREFAPPPARRRDSGLHPGVWPHVEEALGTQLPADYKRLADAYGDGHFNSQLRVATPYTQSNDFEILRFTRTRAEIQCEGREILAGPPSFTPRAGVFPEPGGLLPCAATDTALVVCWITRGPPDAWTVTLVDNDDALEFAHWPYAGNLTRFLRDITSGELVLDPLNDVGYYQDASSFRPLVGYGSS